MMAHKCQYSKIVIPGNLDYTPIAANFTASVAEALGFGEKESRDLKHCTEQVITWAIDYSMAENEKIAIEIACEVIPQGFKIAVKDQGVPFEPSMRSNGHSDKVPSISSLEGHIDEVFFNNMGRQGKEIVLLKYSHQNRITDHYEACELEHSSESPQLSVPKDLTYKVRSMKPDEAIDVSKCIYKGYGYTYPYEHMYFPSKLVEMNRDKSIISAVAVSDHGDVVGHCALMFEHANDQIAEMGLGVVKPEYRAMGCFGKMTEFLIAKAKREQLGGVFVQAVTLHTYSQKTAARYLFKACAVLLSHIPTTVDFRRMHAGPDQRVTVFLCFRYFKNNTASVIYPPKKHRAMIEQIYTNLGISPEMASPKQTSDLATNAESRMRIKVVKSLRFARMVCEAYGHNVVREIEQRVRTLCLEKMEVINLYLDLSNPHTGYISEQIEALGLFFAGILPKAMPNESDALVFQYLNNVDVRYERIKTHSEIAKALITYVNGLDPNRQSLTRPSRTRPMPVVPS